MDFTETSDQEAARASRWGMAAFQGSFLIAVPLGHAGEHIPASAKHSCLQLPLPKHLTEGLCLKAVSPFGPAGEARRELPIVGISFRLKE